MVALALVAVGNASANPPRPWNAQLLAQQKAAAARKSGARPRGTAPRGSTTVFNGLSAGGLAWLNNVSQDQGAPPDTTGAIGPNHYIEMVNNLVGVYSRSNLSQPISTARLANFDAFPNDNVFDVQIQWDPVGRRWFYLNDDCEDTQCVSGLHLDFGFSMGDGDDASVADLSAGWCHYRIDTGNLFEDFPKLGHSDEFILFGTNAFSGADFAGARVHAIPKPAPGALSQCPAQPAETVFDGSQGGPLGGTFTPVPVDAMDAQSGHGYVVAAQRVTGTSGASISMFDITGNGQGGANISFLGTAPTASFGVPDNVNQGTRATSLIDTSDTRLYQAVALTDPDAGQTAIWTQHTIAGPAGQSVVRWYELLPGAPPHVRQSGTIAAPAGLWAWNGAIAPTLSGNEASINFNVGGPSLAPQIWVESRNHADALGAMGDPAIVGASPANAALTDAVSCGQDPKACRWGDYAGATTDPVALHLVWGTNELASAPRTCVEPDGSECPSWLTQNFAVTVGNSPPTGTIVITPPRPRTGERVSFAAANIHDPEGDRVTGVAWDTKGTGVFVPGATAQRTYTRPGLYVVRLRLTDAGGHSHDVAAGVAVADRPPVADLVADPNPAPFGRAVTLDATGSTDPDGTIAIYRFDTDNDGIYETASTKGRIKIDLARAGRTHVGVRVTDDQGASASTRLTIFVGLPPRMAFVKTRITVSRTGGTSIRVRCPRLVATACTGTLELRARRGIGRGTSKGTVLARARFRVRTGRTATLKLHVAAPVLTYFLRAKSLATDARLTAQDAARTKVTVKRTVTLVRGYTPPAPKPAAGT